MPEAEVRDRLLLLAQQRPEEFAVLEGANQRMIRRLGQISDLPHFLMEAYRRVA
jgi:hypothetical protein